jgi:hypothetical protein
MPFSIGNRIMSQPRPPRGLLAVAVVALLAGGCGDRTGGRLGISGTITLAGKPLDEGVIEFHPLDPTPGRPVTKSGALIKDGNYVIPKAQGLVPGRYRVVITAGDKKVPEPGDRPPGPSGRGLTSKERIPPDFNVRSGQVIEVKNEGPNRFDYAIP